MASGSREISDLLMGYSESGPMRNITLMRYAGRCFLCSVRVHVVPSGFEILQRSDCDATLICEKCYNNPHVQAELERMMGRG